MCGPGLSPRVRGNRALVQRHDRGHGSIPARAGEPAAAWDAARAAAVYPRACGGTLVLAYVGDGCQGLSPRVRGNQPPWPRPSGRGRSIPARAGEPSSVREMYALMSVYPRACGGTSPPFSVQSQVSGLSPRVRGNPQHEPPQGRRGGSIPARAGEPRDSEVSRASRGVYPRACGGTNDDSTACAMSNGLSPRVRGNRDARFFIGEPRGSIPARAGEPWSSGAAGRRCSVYPRACGGTWIPNATPSAITGLSPRVRGNPGQVPLVQRRDRSIPARAGEPSQRWRSACPRTVYPRACGGTLKLQCRSEPLGGLSPRVRGNLAGGEAGPPGLGSIPARAGEPAPSTSTGARSRVYPRACGGTGVSGVMTTPCRGLSPRVRGNRWLRRRHVNDRGSIPARAGEPRRAACRGRPWPVYPRACGGTIAEAVMAGRDRGLSPRVRGNLRAGRQSRHAVGSIPARAGEPRASTRGRTDCRVYPRACGGTERGGDPVGRAAGLSPRVRGNLGEGEGRMAVQRSIPARAGEPAAERSSTTRASVYPRACGGTEPEVTDAGIKYGLSPRVRGNPAPALPTVRLAGSIPARAGEPRGRSTTSRRSEVYPRACGGTVERRLRHRPAWGLSPRVRGNPVGAGHELRLHGSIPARAGEPRARIAGSRWGRVYPRACGGTQIILVESSSTAGLSPRVRGNLYCYRDTDRDRRSIPARAGEPSQ